MGIRPQCGAGGGGGEEGEVEFVFIVTGGLGIVALSLEDVVFIFKGGAR